MTDERVDESAGERRDKHARPANDVLDADAYELEETTDLKDSTPDRPKGIPLHTRIFIGLLVGVVAGVGCNLAFGGDNARVTWAIANITEPVGQLFLRLLQMTVIPLVFSSLVIGVMGTGDVRKLGRVGLKCLAYTVVISAISVVIGLTLANTVRPGARIDPATAEALSARYGSDATRRVQDAQKASGNESVMMKVVTSIVPTNPIAAIAGVKRNPQEGDAPDMIHLMFFALILGIAATMISSSVVGPFMRGLEALYEISAKIIDIIMKAAPFAVACLLFNNTARFGIDLLGALGWFVITVLFGLALHMFGVYSLSVYLLSRISPLEFFRRIKTVMLTAFSTSSSNATLPTSLRVTQENLGVPREINSFVLTVGATANQNGTALYEGVTVLFLAQLAGIDLTLGQQVMVAYLAIIGGIGTAGVPSGSIPFIVLVLVTIGVDPALIAIILGVDRILDMCRTTLNVTGDITAATYIARSEGYELLKKPSPA
jgi:DAACS family dicarboxylate/amino acid:cation (Na+ or H+) symporter